MWLLGRLRPLHHRMDAGWAPNVTACIAVTGGRQYISRKLQSVLGQDWPAEKLDVIVYCDGSGDGCSADVQQIAQREPRVRVMGGGKRMGKPSAINAMIKEARGEVLLMTDIRQPLEPGTVRALVMQLADPRVGCVSGNLVLRGETGAGAYWKYEKGIREAEGKYRGLVGVSGSIYAVRKADVAPLPRDTILDDMWIPMALRLRGRLILFARDAIAWDDAEEDEREFTRKVRTLAGNYQLFARIPRLLVPFVNPSWFETFSHKILRLVCPFALVALAVATLLGLFDASLVNGWRIMLYAFVVAQGVFYFGALAGQRAGRLAALARTFMVLNAAAVAGLWRWLRSSQKITW